VKKKSGWQYFLELCRAAASEQELQDLLLLLFTPEEVENLDKRVSLIQALLEEKATQREIAKTLAVSISKITRGSNGLKNIKPRLKQFLKDKLME
jgi:Trp operon repressor